MGQIGRVAVLPQHRGRGVGEALIRAMIDHARALSCREVRLNARESTTGFYQRFGMEETGDRFVEAGVPHRTMRLDLREAPAARPQASGS
jgi:predicted GNAT family N-acyltransferase